MKPWPMPITLALLAACSSGSPDVAAGAGWARATAPGQPTAAVYLTIANRGDAADRLLAVTTEAAAAAALHGSSNADGVARMRPVTDGIALPAGATVELEPGGQHVMLTGLRAPLTAGGRFTIALNFERSGTKSAEVRVVPATAQGLGMVH